MTLEPIIGEVVMNKDQEKLLHDLEKLLHKHVTQNHKLLLILSTIIFVMGVFAQRWYMIFSDGAFLWSMGSFMICIILILVSLLFIQLKLDRTIKHRKHYDHLEHSKLINVYNSSANLCNFLSVIAFIVGLFFIFSCFPKHEILLKDNDNDMKPFQMQNNSDSSVTKNDDMQKVEVNTKDDITKVIEEF